VNLDDISDGLRVRFDLTMEARERALPASRKAIRSRTHPRDPPRRGSTSHTD
jgi:hypothetical protein